MKEKEFRFHRARLDVKDREGELRNAKLALELGANKTATEVGRAKADYDRARAEAEREINSLKEAVRKAEMVLEMERLNLQKAESDFEKGFDE